MVEVAERGGKDTLGGTARSVQTGAAGLAVGRARVTRGVKTLRCGQRGTDSGGCASEQDIPGTEARLHRTGPDTTEAGQGAAVILCYWCNEGRRAAGARVKVAITRKDRKRWRRGERRQNRRDQ